MERELRLCLCPHVLGEEGERPRDGEIWSVGVQETKLENFLVVGFPGAAWEECPQWETQCN